MNPQEDRSVAPAVRRFLDGLAGGELLYRLSWDDWMAIEAPYPSGAYDHGDVWKRYSRNGYDWDIQAKLYTPRREVDPSVAFVIYPGGSGNAHNVDLTPDGRPGLARVLAAQGFKVLSVSYTGLYPPGGVWSRPAATRLPHYLRDRDLPEAEISDRNLKCTFNVLVQGSAELADEHLAGRDIVAYGYSTGGPMAAHLHRFVKNARVKALAGFGSGGPDGWAKEWRDGNGLERSTPMAIGAIMRRTAEGLRKRGYDALGDLCPWGSLERYVEICEPLRSHINLSLCQNQHAGHVERLKEFAARTGLPESEYLDHLRDPDPAWLAATSALLLVGENDHGHWVLGERLQDKLEYCMARRYAERGAKVRLATVPRYGHNGYCERHCEKFAYLWLWAFREGFFERG